VVTGTWHPERSSNRAFPHDKHAITYYGEDREQRVIDAAQIGARESVPVDVRDQAALVDPRAVFRAIDRTMSKTRDFLAEQAMVADACGLDIEVIVRVSGRAWPAVPGITTPESAEAAS
jgi:hypothetical protein